MPDLFAGTFPDRARHHRDWLKKNTRWHGVPITWTGEFKNGEHIVHATAGESPWKHTGSCPVSLGYHLVDACDAIIDAWLDNF